MQININIKKPEQALQVYKCLEEQNLLNKQLKQQLRSVIALDAESAYIFANEVLYDKRFIEAEEVIMKNTEIAYLYSSCVLEKRWPEAEPYIMKDPEYACYYAREVIRGRWPEAESYIMKSPTHAAKYAREHIRGRWFEAERYIMKDPCSSYYYTEYVMKRRWPEFEKKISSSVDLIKQYVSECFSIKEREDIYADLITKYHPNMIGTLKNIPKHLIDKCKKDNKLREAGVNM